MTTYRDPFNRPNFWEQLNRIFGANFRVGTFFGVQVRVLWIAVILFPLLTMGPWVRSGAAAGEVLLAMVVLPLTLLFIIYTHEMMHIAAGWRYRIHTPLITLSPLGGLAHMDAPAPNPRAEMFVSLAGPAVHLLWLAVFYPIAWLGPEFSVSFFWVWVDVVIDVNLVLMIFNLLPIYPMDGGRVLRAFLATRMNANQATVYAARVGKVGAVGIGLYGVVAYDGLMTGILIALAIRGFLDCMMAERSARFSVSPYGPAREPWEEDADWWKGRAGPQGPGSRRPGPLGRFLERRRRRKAAAAAEEQRQLDQDVDAILERVSKVGLTGLTEAERRTLERASKARRKTGG